MIERGLSGNKIESTKENVAVIGAGVIGLSTALLAQEIGYNVTIYTLANPRNTTSMKAAASFKPHEVAYNDLAQKMVELSWENFQKIEDDYKMGAGIRKHVHWEASSAPKNHSPYLDVVENFEYHERSEVPGGYSFGWKYNTFFIDTPIYIPWLERQFTSRDGKVILSKSFEDLEEFKDIPADIIFNCTGLGARELAKDYRVRGMKGQIVLVGKIPDMEWSISADGFYVYPRTNDTVLGGTVEDSVENEIVENGAVHLIIRGNKRILPNLTIDSVTGTYAGIRPYREGGIRLESEERNNQKIIHNYGHGGSGITLSWGSAKLAVKQI